MLRVVQAARTQGRASPSTIHARCLCASLDRSRALNSAVQPHRPLTGRSSGAHRTVASSSRTRTMSIVERARCGATGGSWTLPPSFEIPQPGAAWTLTALPSRRSLLPHRHAHPPVHLHPLPPHCHCAPPIDPGGPRTGPSECLPPWWPQRVHWKPGAGRASSAASTPGWRQPRLHPRLRR